MAFISVTLAVFHELMFWLNAAAPWNMLFMSVTCSVFHDPTSALNDVALLNKAFMSATRLVSQFVIGSYTAAPQSTAIEHVHAPDVTLLKQLFTAVCKAAKLANGPGAVHADAGPSTLPPGLDVYLCLAIHAVAPENMLVALAPAAPVHPVMSLLKLVAPENMELKFATALTTHELMSWLNAVAGTAAPLNMLLMFVTADVTHELMSWLKFVALWNMPLMSVTADVTHELMSWLNARRC